MSKRPVDYTDSGGILFSASYINPDDPWWAFAAGGNAIGANIVVSSITVNPVATGNILLQSAISSGTEYNAPLIFQRPATDINAPSESLVMNLSKSVPGYPVDGQFITATKAAGTAYDDIAVKGLQVFGNQTTSVNTGAAGYITGTNAGIFVNSPALYTSSIFVSSLTAGTVISPGTATSFTASLFMSTPVLYSDTVFVKQTAQTSSLTVTAQANIDTLVVSKTNATLITADRVNATSLYGLNFVSTPLVRGFQGQISFLSTGQINTNYVFAAATVSSNISTQFLSANQAYVSTLSTLSMAAQRGVFSTLSGSNIQGRGISTSQLQIFDPTFIVNPGGIKASTNTLEIDAESLIVYKSTINLNTFSINADATATFLSTVFVPNVTVANSIRTPLISTGTISTGSIAVTTISTTTLNATTANISTANVSSITIGNFAANRVDANTLSSLTGNITVNLVSTLQLTANVSVSPNVNLGLGNVIQGLIGGAATQGLGVIVGATGLITGATALVLGRTGGGVATNPGFQMVNTTTQLQFSTLGVSSRPAYGVNTLTTYLTTDQGEPTTGQSVPGNPRSITTFITPGTYCVRSISDPIFVDSSFQAVQAFGEWQPVIQSNASFPVINVSSIVASNIFSQVGVISTLTVSTLNAANTVLPDLLRASTISVSGNLNNTNPAGSLIWTGTSYLPSTIVNRITFFDNFLGNQGSMFGINQTNTGITTVTRNGMRIQNSENPLLPTIGFNQDATIDVYSTLKIQPTGVLLANNAFISTLTVSTLNFSIQSSIPSTLSVSTLNASGNVTVSQTTNTRVIEANIGSVSSLTVSSINGLPPNSGGTLIPSTINASTIIMNGNLEGLSLGANLFWPGTTSIPNTSVNNLTFRNILGQATGSIISSNAVNGGITVIGAGGFTINGTSNTSAIFNPNGTTQFFSTVTLPSTLTVAASISSLNVSSMTAFTSAISSLQVSTLQANAAGISTAQVSTMVAGVVGISSLTNSIASISSLNVSTVNNLPYPPTFLLPSTLNASTINVTGNLTVTNPAGVIQGAQTLVQSYSIANTNNVSQGTLSGGNPDLGLQGAFIAAPNGLRVSAGGNFTQPIFAATVTSGFATLTMGGTGSANSIIYSQIMNATSNFRILPTGSATIPLNILAPNTTDGLIQANGALSISTNVADSGAPGFGPFNVNAQNINLYGQAGLTLTSSVPSIIKPGINTSTITVSSINGVVYPPPAPFTMPVGSVIIWSGLPTAPAGWLICDGSAVSTTTYAALYGVVGLRYVTIYQPAPPAGNFYLPDLTYAVPMGGSQTTYAPIISVRTGPDINSYCPPGSNKLWEVQAVVRGQLNLTTRFRLVGAVGDIFIQKFIDWNPSTNSGFLLVICNDTTIPTIGPGFFPLTSAGGVAGALYTSGKYGGTGVPNTVKTMTLEEIAPHTHGGSPGTYTTGMGASPPQAGTNGPTVYQDGVNSINGVGFVNTSYRMDPNYISMYYIIKT